MRLSTSTNIFIFDNKENYSIGIEDSVRACARAGYRYLDANLCSQARDGQPLTKDDWEEWARGLRWLGDELSIRFTQAHAYFPYGYTVYPDGSRSDGEFGEELLRRSVIAAEILGCGWAVVHPLTVRAESWFSYKKSYEYNREYYGRWGEFFARHNVGMALENMICANGKVSYCASPDELIELVETLDDPMAGICLDTGHAHVSGVDVAAVVKKFSKHLRATHIADNHRNHDEHFAPFNGTIDWPEVMRAFQESGYSHDFAFEIHHLTSPYPAAVQEELIRFSFGLGKYLFSLGAPADSVIA